MEKRQGGESESELYQGNIGIPDLVKVGVGGIELEIVVVSAEVDAANWGIRKKVRTKQTNGRGRGRAADHEGAGACHR